MCLHRSPYYGLLTYMFVYFIAPNPQINWWATEIPNFRWSVLSAAILIIGCFIHKDKLSRVNLGSIQSGKWLVSFLILSLIVSLVAVHPGRSFDRCYDFSRYVVVVYLLVAVVKEEQELEGLILLILLCGLLLGYFAYNTPRHGGRLEGVGTSDTDDANNFALLLVTMIPFMLPALLSKNKFLKYSVPVCSLFIFNAIILCNSRGAILALFASFIFLILSLKIQGLKRKIIIAGILAGCVFAYLTDDVFWERFNTIQDSAKKDKGAGRLDTWLEGLQMVKDYPFGTGGDGFRVLSPHYITNLTGGVRSAHNTYLEILVEQGYLGLIIFLGLNIHILFILKKGRNLILSKQIEAQLEDNYRFLYLTNIAINTALVGHFTGAIFGSRLYYEFYYFLIGLATISHNMIIEKVYDRISDQP